jgi:hypothetical protein
VKVATPFTGVTVVVPVRVAPVDTLTVTVLVAVLTTLLKLSWIETTGCVVRGAPLAPPTGAVVKANFVADPTGTVTAAVAAVSVGVDVNVSVYVAPGVPVSVTPEKVAVPLDAVTVVVPLKVPPELVIVTWVALSEVTTLPPGSCTCTTGCGDKADPEVPAVGEVETTSFEAAPRVTVTFEVAEVNPLDVKVNW